MNKMVVVAVGGALLVVGLILWMVSSTKSRMSNWADEMAEQAAQNAGDVDPELLEDPEGDAEDDLPPFFTKKVAHLKAMSRIMKVNIGDCETLGQEIEAYTTEHQEEMEELDRAEAKAKREMSPAERQRFEKKAMARIKPLLFDMVKMAALVAFKCPQQAGAIERAKARAEQ